MVQDKTTQGKIGADVHTRWCFIANRQTAKNFLEGLEADQAFMLALELGDVPFRHLIRKQATQRYRLSPWLIPQGLAPAA